MTTNRWHAQNEPTGLLMPSNMPVNGYAFRPTETGTKKN